MADVSTTERSGAGIEMVPALLDHLRQRLDVLKLRLALARLEARDRDQQRACATEDACLSNRSTREGEAGHDVVVTADSLVEGVNQLVRDVQAIEAAEAVIARD